jgi:hypothetical protein
MSVAAWQWWMVGPIVLAAAMFGLWHLLFGRKGC